MRATVITDASFCPNTRSGGWAAWITTDARRVKRSGTFKKRVKNSTQAEEYAAYNGIHLAMAIGASEILIQTDCLGVVSKINKKHADGEPFKGVKLRAKHVRGHTDTQDKRSWVNRWCDKMARKHMKQQRLETK